MSPYLETSLARSGDALDSMVTAGELIAALRDELAAARTALAETEDRLSLMEAEARKPQEAERQAVRLALRLQTELDASVSAVADLRVRLDEAEARAAIAESALNRSKGETEAVRARLDEALESAAAQVAALIAEADELRVATRDAQTRADAAISEASARLAAREAELEVKALALVRDAQARADEAGAALARQAAHAERALKRAAEEREALQEQLSQATAALAQNEAAQKDLADSLARWKAAAKAATDEAREAQASVQAVEAELVALSSQHVAHLDRIQDLEGRFAASSLERANAYAALERHCDDLLAQMSGLRLAMQAAEALAADRESLAGLALARQAELEHMVASLRDDCAAWQRSAELARADAERATMQHQDYRDDVEKSFLWRVSAPLRPARRLPT